MYSILFRHSLPIGNTEALYSSRDLTYASIQVCSTRVIQTAAIQHGLSMTLPETVCVNMTAGSHSTEVWRN